MKNVPQKHHYLPEFYLSRWKGAGGQLCEFSCPYNQIKSKRVHPAQTGYVLRLYETRGLPLEQAQQVEQLFMQPVDTLAATALAMLENDDGRIHREPNPRSAWSCFIMSLLMRMPEDLAAPNIGLAEEMERRLITQYAIKKGPNDPSILDAYLTSDPNYFERQAMSLIPQLIDHQNFGQLLNNMRWFVRRIPCGAGEFLTSDRPIVMSWTLTEPYAYLFLPVGPKAMFVAVNDVETQRIVEKRDATEQVEAVNRFVAGRAVKFVYARDDRPLNYVRQHMGTKPRRTLIERLVVHRREIATVSGSETVDKQ